MPGRGEGGRDSRKGTKHHGNNIQGIQKPSIRRLARRGGVDRITNQIYQDANGALSVFLNKIIRNASNCSGGGNCNKKTITALDVESALIK